MKKLFAINYNRFWDTKAAEIEFPIKGTHESNRILFYRDKYNRPAVYLAHQVPKFGGRCVPYDYTDYIYGLWTMTESQANELYNFLVKSIAIDSKYDIHLKRRKYDFSPKLEVLYEAIISYVGK